MTYYIAYDPLTLQIKSWYEYTHVLDQDDDWVHVEIVPPLHYQCVKVVNDENGNPKVIRDDEKWDEKFTHEMKILRSNRNQLLLKSDISQLDDIKTEMSDEKRTEWVIYRRQLRDFPSTVTDPFNPVWPTPPE
tara:strand:+ start:1740 stop:2138 length:399 start_codon:yes stop_codon:yes gene_type:complete